MTNYGFSRNPLDLRSAGDEFREDFWSKVDIRDAGECWPWLAGYGSHGYGQFYIATKVPVTAMRIALALDGHVLTHIHHSCHTCDNRQCVNPAHLFVGTARDNTNDCIQKGRGNRSHGESHRDARLTEEIVRNLRRNAPYRHGEMSHIARELGCSLTAVRRAIAGATWKHVGTEEAA